MFQVRVLASNLKNRVLDLFSTPDTILNDSEPTGEGEGGGGLEM